MWNKITGLTDASALLAQVFSASDSTRVVTGTGVCSSYVGSAHTVLRLGFFTSESGVDEALAVTYLLHGTK